MTRLEFMWFYLNPKLGWDHNHQPIKYLFNTTQGQTWAGITSDTDYVLDLNSCSCFYNSWSTVKPSHIKFVMGASELLNWAAMSYRHSKFGFDHRFFFFFFLSFFVRYIPMSTSAHVRMELISLVVCDFFIQGGVVVLGLKIFEKHCCNLAMKREV